MSIDESGIKPGDYVRIITDEHGAPVGTVVRVVEVFSTVNSKYDKIRYDWDDIDFWLASPETVELVPVLTPTTGPIDIPGVSTSTIEVPISVPVEEDDVANTRRKTESKPVAAEFSLPELPDPTENVPELPVVPEPEPVIQGDPETEIAVPAQDTPEDVQDALDMAKDEDNAYEAAINRAKRIDQTVRANTVEIEGSTGGVVRDNVVLNNEEDNVTENPNTVTVQAVTTYTVAVGGTQVVLSEPDARSLWAQFNTLFS